MSNVSYDFPYPSQRMPVLARNVVATSQPLAAQAGLRMLLNGGNAIDAALAAAIALTVVEPTSNGIGSDAFAIVWDGSKLHGLNASGRSPAKWTSEFFKNQFDAMPLRGWHSVTVPGAVSAWVELSRRFGALPFENLFEPAIEYARDGFPVSPITAEAWQRSVEILKGFPTFLQTFAPDARAPHAGEIFRSDAHARTLELIARTRGEAFYRGELAAAIAQCARDEGGLLDERDMAEHRAEWVDTIWTDHRARRLHEIPPNGQGIAALLALGILRHSPLAASQIDSGDFLHLQIEALKLALADAHRYVSDANHMDEPVENLLDDAYARDRAKLILLTRATVATHGAPAHGDTVYLTAADRDGRMVSFIQSNYYGFGSGVVVPGTGIALQNRGAGFTLEVNHPNQVGPRKRPFHTIIPAFVTRSDATPLMSFGVMGGPMQAQGHVQMMVRTFDFGQNPQAASDAPRWQVTRGLEVLVEQGFPLDVLNDLRARGHDVKIAEPEQFGGAQLIHKLEDGYLAASDHRKDGQAVGF
jgi:gamma-glutamyltranspeptidase/glutathione hydrolase